MQILNANWIEISRHLAFVMLSALATIVIPTLYIIIRGNVGDFTPTVIVGIYVLGITTSGSLFVGGELFFRFSLQLPNNSTNCWLTFLQMEKRLSKIDQGFFKSCRHISNTMGFCFITNPEITLIFFGNIVLKTVIDLLLTFRW